MPKIAEESAEVLEAMDGGDAAAVHDELGDLLFAVVNVARHLDIEPEAALRAATRKFRTPVRRCRTTGRERGIDVAGAGLEALDALWDEVKGVE